jgi:hypothetical protein
VRQDVVSDSTRSRVIGDAAGDQDAFAELVGRYRNQLTGYIIDTNDYDGAVDLARNVRLYRAVDRHQTSHAFRLPYRIATNGHQ